MRLTLFITSILLANSISVLGQSDTYHRTYLKELKGMKVDSDASRNIIISSIDEAMEAIKDSATMELYNNYRQDLVRLAFIDSKARSFAEVPRDLLKRFDNKYDKFSKVRYLTPKGALFDNIVPYIVIDENNRIYLRSQVKFKGSGWVFMDEILVHINDEVYNYQFKNDPTREVLSHRTVEEKYDELVDVHFYEILKEIGDSQSTVTIRFQGDKYYDAKLSGKNANRIKETIELFNYLKLY